MQAKTKAARDSGNYHAPIVHVIDRRTTPIIDDYERGAGIGGVLLAVMFGIMFIIGAWFGWA